MTQRNENELSYEPLAKSPSPQSRQRPIISLRLTVFAALRLNSSPDAS